MIELNPKFHTIDFKNIDEKFTEMFNDFSPVNSNFSIENYFGEGLGLSTSLKTLLANSLIYEPEDFQGIYVFFKDNHPFYVGISRHVIKRITQHVKGKNHFSSSLCYRLGANLYEKEMGVVHSGGRAGLDFKKYCDPGKAALMKCNVAFYKVEDFLELYLFEVYVAMKLGTLHYNLFETH